MEMLFSRVAKFCKDSPEKQLIGFNRVLTISYGSTKKSIFVDPCEHLSFANVHVTRILTLEDHTLLLEDLEHHFD